MNWENAFWFRIFGAGVFVGFLVRKVFGLVSSETLLKGFWRLGVFGVFGGREFLGFLAFLNFKYILWN